MTIQDGVVKAGKTESLADGYRCTFEIAGLKRENGGSYRCEITNKYGARDQRQFTIYALEPGLAPGVVAAIVAVILVAAVLLAILIRKIHQDKVRTR